MATHVEKDVTDRMAQHNEDFVGLVQEAREATETEHQMSLWQGIKLYPKAVGWSMLLSTAIIMEGYDVVLLGTFYAYPAFQKKYGVLQPDGSYQLTAAWQSGLSNGANVGEILGLFINGIVSERYGYRKVMIVSLACLVGCIFIPFFAPNVHALEAGEILMGIPWGVFQTLTTAYASEVCPVVLRAYLCTYVNLCWVMGQLIASGVLRGLLSRTDQWAYRIPFALQWIWPIPILIGCLFAPESPWWLVRKGRTEDAERSLRRLTSANDPTFNAEQTIAMMVHTNEMEKQITAGQSYWDCFKGTDLRRTEIACVTWSIQNLCGSAFMGYSTYFYEQAGLAEADAFDMSLAQYAIGFMGTILSWFLMGHFGRRTLYLYGLVIMTVLLFIIGFVALAPESNNGARWAIGSMLLVYTFFYDSTVGPVCYSLVAEISSTRLRAKTIVLARNLYNVFGIVNGVITPFMLNPSAWNWKGKSGFFWGSMCFLCVVWTYFRLPEPKGRTYGELDVMFEQRISARKFSQTVVDPFHDVHQTKGKSYIDNEKDDSVSPTT